MFYITWKLFKFWILMISLGILWYYNFSDNCEGVRNILEYGLELTVSVVFHSCFQMRWIGSCGLNLLWSLLSYNIVLRFISGLMSEYHAEYCSNSSFLSFSWNIDVHKTHYCVQLSTAIIASFSWSLMG